MAIQLTLRRVAVLVGATTVFALTGTAGIAAGLLAGGGGGSDGGGDQPITGTALQRAEESALAETGGGEVTETEVETDENGYEVEVRLDDGSTVEVQLDADFAVVGTDADSDGGSGEDGSGDDGGGEDRD